MAEADATDVTLSAIQMAERAFKERDLCRRIIYKMQMPANVDKLARDFLNPDELAAYKRAVVESI